MLLISFNIVSQSHDQLIEQVYTEYTIEIRMGQPHIVPKPALFQHGLFLNLQTLRTMVAMPMS
jgi:hypothetical protein